MNESEPETKPQPTVSIGETLKNLREERNLAISEIASALHLDPRIIELLERDAFEELPAGIFVRGYIRNYAKQLDVSADELIHIYDETGLEEEPEIIPEIKHPRQSSSSDKPVKAFTYLLTLVFVVLVIAWWQTNFLISPESITGAETEESRARPPAFDYSFEVVKHPEIPYYEKPPEPDIETVESGADSGATPSSAATPDTAPGEQDTAGGEVITSDITGPDRLVLRLTADSWIEIFDAGDREVYVNLARAGDTLILHGKAPFSILLGFAQGVEITFNGKEYNSASHSRAGVARFTLGEQERE